MLHRHGVFFRSEGPADGRGNSEQGKVGVSGLLAKSTLGFVFSSYDDFTIAERGHSFEDRAASPPIQIVWVGDRSTSTFVDAFIHTHQARGIFIRERPQ